MNDIPIMCIPDAIPAAQRPRSEALWAYIKANAQVIRELDNGFAVQLPNDDEAITNAATFITLERLCCPFLEFGLEVSGPTQEVWLSFTGRAGVKDFLAQDFADFAG